LRKISIRERKRERTGQDKQKRENTRREEKEEMRKKRTMGWVEMKNSLKQGCGSGSSFSL
jgi:hypothetical protein